MADIFAPQLKTEVSYERPVQEQQVSSPFAGLLQDIGGLFASQGGSPTTKVDPNLSAFSSDIEMVEQIRQEQGDQAANLAERKIARKFSSYGVDFDESYKSVYEKQTGRSFDLYGLDPETYFKQEQMKDPEFQKLYLASKVFNPNASEEESLAYATNQYNYIKASQASVNAKNAAGVLQWDAETETHYNSTLDNFLKNNIAALTELSNRGERIGPTYLQSLKTSFDVLLSTGLNRPRGITEEQWKPFQAKINNVEKTINSLEKLFGDETKAKEFLSALAESVRKGDGNAVAKGIMSGALASADFATLIPMVGADAFETITTVMKQPELNIRRPDILLGFQNSVAANQEAGVAPDLENQEITQFPESIVKQVQGMSPQELYQSMKANGLLVLMSNPDSMNREEGREQLENGIYKISAVLANNKEGDMLSYDFHAKLFANQGLFKTIDALEVRDPEAGRLVKASLRSGISAEIIRHDAYLDSIERSVSIAEWDGTRYVVNEDALKETGALGRSREEFLIKLKQNYNGDLGRAVKDKFSRMQRVYMDEIRSFARGLSNLNLALDSRKTLSLLENTRKQLNKSSLDEVTVPDNTIDTLPEANLRSNADREELLGSIRETISNPRQRPSDIDQPVDVPTPTPRPDDLNQPVNAPMPQPRPSDIDTPTAPDNVEFSFIRRQEGERLDGYIPEENGKVLGNSGVTISTGFDLGQHSESDLKGLPQDIIDKLKPYLGKTGQEAQNFLQQNPLRITEDESIKIDSWNKKTKFDLLARRWKQKTGQDFSNLDRYKATTVASVAFQYGDLEKKTPNFWRYVTSGDWEQALKELRNFKDKYPSRRNREADLLEASLRP